MFVVEREVLPRISTRQQNC